MKNNWRNNIIVLMVVAMVAFSCEKKSGHAQHDDAYTCPMHPEVNSPDPGTCPVCGMDLVLKNAQGQAVEITDDLAPLLKSANEQVTANIKTVNPTYQKLTFPLPADGMVTYDTRSVYTIPSRIAGRLEKVFLKSSLTPVKKGQKVAEIYSPELVAAQRELLFVLEDDPNNGTLMQSARNKLMLLGMSNAQIESVVKAKSVHQTFTLYSPYDGYVVLNTESVVPQTGATPGQGMDAMASAKQSTASLPEESILREGDYVSAGQTLFRIINPSMLRVELNLPAEYGEYVKNGDVAQLDFGEGHHETARVNFVQPFFTKGESFVKVRLYTSKTDMLHIGHLVRAILSIQTTESLWLPTGAVLDLGHRQVVFRKGRSIFEPVEISAGLKTGTWIQVQGGVASADEVAVNAQYLMDSEGFIKLK